MEPNNHVVIPAKAGTQCRDVAAVRRWTAAFAGATTKKHPFEPH